MTKFLQTLMDASAIGSSYALIALGYTMVYGILKFINFAHGDVFMIGAWLSFMIAKHAGWIQQPTSPYLMVPVVLFGAMAGCALVGFLIERLAYRPLQKAPRLNVLITAIGVSLLIQNTGQLPQVFGAQPQRMPSLLPNVELFSVGGVAVHLVDVLGITITLTLMAGLEYLVYRTRTGRAMRAVSHNPEVAALMGIPVGRIISFTFVLGSALAGAAGFLNSMKYATLATPSSSTWMLLGLKAFVAAVVGGIGNIHGAVVGGLLIGIVEQFGVAYFSTQLRDVYVFTLLIAVLLVRPTGLFGRTAEDKL